jgi:hypothetical protein
MTVNAVKWCHVKVCKHAAQDVFTILDHTDVMEPLLSNWWICFIINDSSVLKFRHVLVLWYEQVAPEDEDEEEESLENRLSEDVLHHFP